MPTDLLRTAIVGGIVLKTIKTLDRDFKKNNRPVLVRRGFQVGRLGR